MRGSEGREGKGSWGSWTTAIHTKGEWGSFYWVRSGRGELGGFRRPGGDGRRGAGLSWRPPLGRLQRVVGVAGYGFNHLGHLEGGFIRVGVDGV